MKRSGSEITLRLDKEENAIGLYAVLAGKQAEVSPEVYKHGQEIYGWFFNAVQKLALDHAKEGSLKTQSQETLSGPPTLAKKARKR